MVRIIQRVLAAALVVAACQGCVLDSRSEKVTSGAQGTVAFVGQWPDSLVEVRAAAFRTYPPADFNVPVAWSDPLLLGVSEADYLLPLVPGEYAVVVVSGRFAGQSWTLLSEYSLAGSTVPDTVCIAGDSIVPGIDVVVTFGSAGSGISGELLFRNAWDDTVASLRVGALIARMTDPLSPPITLADVDRVSQVFTRTDTSFAYRIPLPPGIYRTVGVVWMGYGPSGEPDDWLETMNVLKLLSRPVLGVYGGDDSLVPDSVVVHRNQWVKGVEVVVDFARARM